MGLISTALSTASGVIADQWKEYFYCDALPVDVLAAKGKKRVSGRNANRGNDNIISNGSVIAVADGQCMLIVEQGKVVEVCAEPGEFKYDSSTEPSILAGGLNKDTIMGALAAIGKRFTFGGETAKDQRVYYISTRELVGNKYGTPSPVPFRVVDRNANIDIDIDVRCFGEYSYRIANPLLFYVNVCANFSGEFRREQIDSQLKSELLTALQPAFARISALGVRYSALPGHTMEMADALNEVLSKKWRELRGIEIVSFGVSSIKASEEDEKMLKDLQRAAALRDPEMRKASFAGAMSSAVQDAAKNTAGASVGFMGVNMAMGAAGTMGNIFEGNYQQSAAPAAAPAADSWQCSCGNVASGKFCTECGAKKPVKIEAGGWTCTSCGAVNKGKFCSECGAKKPAAAPLYKCDKCGWEPADPAHPPKFCPECGDPFGAEDII